MIAKERWRSLAPRAVFVLFSVVVTAYGVYGLTHLIAPGGTDYWEHLATIGSFARSPLHPENPYLPTSAPTHLFTPHHLVWGLVLRLTGVGPVTLTVAIGTTYLVVFFYGVHRFATSVLRDPWAPALLAPAMLFLWGGDVWAWSGFNNFGLLPLTAVYPYWGVLGVSLVWLGRANAQQSAGLGAALVDVPVVALSFVTHPLGGIFLGVSLSAIRARAASSRPAAVRAALLPATGFALAFLWPYFPVARAVLASRHFEELEFAGSYSMFYEQALPRFGVALVGIAHAVRCVRRRELTLAARGLLVFVALYLANWAVLHNPVFSRFFVYVAFFLHLSLVTFIVEDLPAKARPFALVAFAALVVYAGREQVTRSRMWISSDASTRLQTAVAVAERASSYAEHLSTRDVLLTRFRPSFQYPAILGCKVVAVIHSNPFFDDYRERKSTILKFYDKRTSAAERDVIVARYQPTHLLVSPDDQPWLELASTKLESIRQGPDGVLYRVVPAATDATDTATVRP